MTLKHTFTDLFVEPEDFDDSTLFGELLDNYLLWPRDKRRRKFNEDVMRYDRFLDDALGIFGMGEAFLRFLNSLDEGDRKLDVLKMWRRYQGACKAPPVARIVKAELESGEVDKIVLFTTFKVAANLLVDGLHGFGAAALYDQTPRIKAMRIAARFVNKPESRVLVVNTKAADVRLDLTVAHEAIVVEPDWLRHRNPQACMRLIKNGQDHNVRIRFAGINNALDGKISRALKNDARTVVFGSRDPFAD